MAPPRGSKRKSDGSVSAADHVEDAQDMTAQGVAIEAGSPAAQDSPRKKQRTGISMSQKQALIDNLQLESTWPRSRGIALGCEPDANASVVTERARKLRAQYNLQAQGLRTRIEIRVNRIPMSLRKAKMGDLADKHKRGQHPQQARPTPSFSVLQSARRPPVSEDNSISRSVSTTSTKSQATTASRPRPGSPPKRTRFGLPHSSQGRTRTNSSSDEISGNSKENDGTATGSEAPKKKARSNPAAEVEPTKASNVLSPASTNVRPLPRTTPGGKPPIMRVAPAPENAPGLSKSPVKQSSASSLFSNWAEKARSTRKDAAGKRGNATASTTASSATGMSGRKPGTTPAMGATKGAATTKARRISGISESSESSASTVVKKGTGKAAETKTASAPAKKTGVMSTIKRGVTGAGSIRKTAAAKVTPASTATGRVLRKRT